MCQRAIFAYSPYKWALSHLFFPSIIMSQPPLIPPAALQFPLPTIRPCSNAQNAPLCQSPACLLGAAVGPADASQASESLLPGPSHPGQGPGAAVTTRPIGKEVHSLLGTLPGSSPGGTTGKEMSQRQELAPHSASSRAAFSRDNFVWIVLSPSKMSPDAGMGQ